MRVLMRGKVRARRLIIANAAYDPPKHRGIGHVDTGVVLDHFCSYPRTRVSRFC